MNRAVVEALVSAPGGGALVWALIEREEVLARKREVPWHGERESWQRECESWQRERDLLAAKRRLELDAERAYSERLQYKLDVVLGHATVCSVLDQVALAFAPDKSAAEALEAYCDQESFRQYLGVVSETTGVAVDELTK